MSKSPTMPWWAALGAALVLSATACAPGSSPDAGDEPEPSEVETDVASMGDITLTVWDQEVRGGQAEQIEALNKAFQEEYPNIEIERVSRSFEDLQRTLRLAINSNDAPDVVQANNSRSGMGAFVTAGQLQPLDPYAEAYGWDERFPESVRAVSSYSEDGETFGEGNLYGLPQTGELVGVWYNRTKLEELDIEPPQTWEDFEAALTAAKKAGEIPIQFGNLDAWPGIHEFGFVQNAFVSREEVRDLGFGREGASWTTPENTEAAETIQGWAESGFFTEGFNGFGYDPSWQAFAKGEGVFLISGTWLLADLQAALGDDLGFMLPPVGPTGELAVTGATGLPFAVTEASENADAAAAYLDFITSDEAMGMIQEAGNLPVLETDAETTGQAQSDVIDAWKRASGEDALTPYLDWATLDSYDVLSAQVQDLLGGSTTPDDFLSTLEEDYTSSLEE